MRVTAKRSGKPAVGRTPRFLIALLFFALASGAGAQMRCGNALVEEGDYKAQVLLKCGEPLLRDRFYEGAYFPCRIIEQWTYDLGPQKFLRLLTFEEGQLREIEKIERP